MSKAVFLAAIITLFAQPATAVTPFNECLGRLRFEAPEEFEWATTDIERFRMDKSSGHDFSKKIGAVRDYLSYEYDGLVVKVSRVTKREEFDRARNAIIADADDYKKYLQRELSIANSILDDLRKANDASGVAEYEGAVKTLEEKISGFGAYEHDLGIPDAHVIGSKNTPAEFLLWRNSRVYYFGMSKVDRNSGERIKQLVARFEPRELYQVPTGPGVCFPYGFIHDDGTTGFRVKNSLRFQSTPNVIMSMIHASPEMQTKPTLGIYTTHFQPGYDNHLWKKSSILQALHFGKRITTLEGWRLDPRPGSGKEDRAWFAMAHVGGLVRPLMAVHMHTFPKGTGGLETLTPSPEDVIPKFLQITESIRDL